MKPGKELDGITIEDWC